MLDRSAEDRLGCGQGLRGAGATTASFFGDWTRAGIDDMSTAVLRHRSTHVSAVLLRNALYAAVALGMCACGERSEGTAHKEASCGGRSATAWAISLEADGDSWEVAVGELLEAGERAAAVLERLLAHESARVRGRTLAVLREYADPSAGILRETVDALGDEDRNVAMTAILCLRNWGGRCVPELVSALKSDSEAQKVGAARLLGLLGSAASCGETALVECLGDDCANVRATAATALGRIGASSTQAVAALARACADGDPPASASAAEALGRLGGRAAPAMDALRDFALRERSVQSVNLGLWAIGRIGADGVDPVRWTVSGL